MAEAITAQVSAVDNGFVVRYAEVVSQERPVAPAFGADSAQVVQLFLALFHKVMGEGDAGEDWKKGQRDDQIEALKAEVERFQQAFQGKSQVVHSLVPRAVICPTFEQAMLAVKQAAVAQQRLNELVAAGERINPPQAMLVPMGPG